MNHHILTIEGCKDVTHFDLFGKLSNRGKLAYWKEMDELLEKFDRKKIQLLPNPVRQGSKPWKSERRWITVRDRKRKNNKCNKSPRRKNKDQRHSRDRDYF